MVATLPAHMDSDSGLPDIVHTFVCFASIALSFLGITLCRPRCMFGPGAVWMGSVHAVSHPIQFSISVLTCLCVFACVFVYVRSIAGLCAGVVPTQSDQQLNVGPPGAFSLKDTHACGCGTIAQSRSCACLFHVQGLVA